MEVWTIPEEAHRSELMKIVTARLLCWQLLHALSTPDIPTVGSAQHHSLAPLEPRGTLCSPQV